MQMAMRMEGPGMAEILVLYYSRGGSVARLARQVARGIGEVDGMQRAAAHACRRWRR